MTEVVYGAGRTRNVQWAFRGPRILGDPAAGVAAWERSLRTGLQRLMSSLKDQARAAYADVPVVRDGFSYDTQTSPFARGRLLQRSDRFALLEFPTRPHVIRAKHAPYLVFRIDGHWVRVKSVNHPGTKGRHAIDPIFARAEARFVALLHTAAQEMLAI